MGREPVKQKMRARSEFPERIKKLRGELNQASFAKMTGLPQSKVSEYESGVRRPSLAAALAFMKYAEKLGLKEEVRWFSQNVPSREVKRFVKDFWASAPELLSPVRAYTPAWPGGPDDDAGNHYGLPVSKWMGAHHRAKNMHYSTVGDDFVFPFRRGDVVFYDISYGEDLSELVDLPVVAHRSPTYLSRTERTKLENKWAAKYLTREEASRRRALHQFPFLRTGLFVGRMVINQTLGFLPTIQVHTNSGDILLEYLNTAPVGGARDLWGEETAKRLMDLDILGRYVGWISGPPKGLPKFEELNLRPTKKAVEQEGSEKPKGTSQSDPGE